MYYRGEIAAPEYSKSKTCKQIKLPYFKSTGNPNHTCKANRYGKTAHKNLQHRNVIISVLEKNPKNSVAKFYDGRYGPQQKKGIAELSPSPVFRPSMAGEHDEELLNSRIGSRAICSCIISIFAGLKSPLE